MSSFKRYPLVSFDFLSGDSAQRFDILVDPTDVVGHAGIHARQTGTSATNAEADDTLEDVSRAALHDEWAARVTLAGILSSLAVSSAQHLSRVDFDALAAVAAGALSAADGGHADLHQDLGSVVSTLSGQAPTSDCGFRGIRGILSSSGQASWLNARGELDWFVQLDDSDVIGGGVGVVLWVVHDLGSANRLLAAGWAAQIVSAGTDGQVRSTIVYAMGGSHDDIGLFLGAHTDQGTAAEVATTLLHADDPRVRTGTCFHTTDDTLVFLVWSVGPHADAGLAARLSHGQSDGGR